MKMTRVGSSALAAVFLIGAQILAASNPALAQTCGYVQECGDVNASDGVTATDALKVLKQSVGAEQGLTCACSEDSAVCDAALATCQDDLSAAQTDLTTCGEDKTTCGNDLKSCNADLETCGSDIKTCTGDLESCEGDVATCDGEVAKSIQVLATCASDCTADVRSPLRTGQTNCYDNSDLIQCKETGQDGELQRGTPQKFSDNGDGTITDNTTNLVWEKLSDDGSIHDKDSTYTWNDAFAVKVATLNSENFAGQSDWRMPNLNELLTLWNVGAVYPAAFQAFNNACDPDCTVLTCSCTPDGAFLSSSTVSTCFTCAWGMTFQFNGNPLLIGKANANKFRAVRGGV